MRVYRWCVDRGKECLFKPIPNPWSPGKEYVYASTNPENWRDLKLQCYVINVEDDKVIVVDAEMEPGIGEEITEWLAKGIPITRYGREFAFDTVLIPFPIRGVRVSEDVRQRFLRTWSE